MHNSTGRRWAWLPLALVVAASGCEPGVSPEVQAQLAAARLTELTGRRHPGLDSAAGNARQRATQALRQGAAGRRLAESSAWSRAAAADRARRERTLKTQVANLEQMVKGFE
jgi:hypothetical protein